jgi:hypothetical protein
MPLAQNTVVLALALAQPDIAKGSRMMPLNTMHLKNI